MLTCDADIGTNAIVQKIMQEGYSTIFDYHYTDHVEDTVLLQIKNTYSNLSKDTYSPGNRYRAYNRCTWNSDQNKLRPIEKALYFQSAEYNELDGGKVRDFSAIQSEYLTSSLINLMIKKNIEIAHQVGVIDLEQKFEIGLHQIRYQASPNSPAFSSPIWLHKDDERLVFIHLFHYSDNATGGDLLIAKNKSNIDDMISLRKPIDSLVVNQKHFHALTPLGTINRENAYRDILLVTFT